MVHENVALVCGTATAEESISISPSENNDSPQQKTITASSGSYLTLSLIDMMSGEVVASVRSPQPIDPVSTSFTKIKYCLALFYPSFAVYNAHFFCIPPFFCASDFALVASSLFHRTSNLFRSLFQVMFFELSDNNLTFCFR
jgi:hypothetical protein